MLPSSFIYRLELTSFHALLELDFVKFASFLENGVSGPGSDWDLISLLVDVDESRTFHFGAHSVDVVGRLSGLSAGIGDQITPLRDRTVFGDGSVVGVVAGGWLVGVLRV